MAHDVFISYSTRDKPSADAVCAFLEARKIRCWIAPRDLPAGGRWPGGLLSAIDHSRVFVLVFSDGANSSPQVLNEVAAAVKRAIPIIPLRIEAVQPSDDMEYYIETIHWLDALTPPLEQHLGKLADQVKALLAAPVVSTPGTPVVETPAAPAAPVERRRPPWVWAVAALALVLAGVGLRSLITRAPPGVPAVPTAAATSLPVAAATATARPPATVAPATAPASTAPPAATPTTAPTQAPPTPRPTPVPTQPPPTPLPTASSAVTLRAVPGPVVPVGGHTVLWSPDGNRLLVGGTEVYYLDTATWKQVRSTKSYSERDGLAISPNGAVLAVFREGVKLYEMASGGQLQTLFTLTTVGGTACGSPLAFSQDGATLAVLLGDVVKFYDVGGGQELNTIVAKGVQSMAWAPGGKAVYVGRWEGIEALDAATGELLYTLAEERGEATCLALSPDGTLLAAAGTSSSYIALRDTATGRLVRTLQGHSAAVTRLAFSPDGQVLASAGDDITIRLWDVRTGALLQTLIGHTAVPQSLGFSPDGAVLASADRSRGVRLWNLSYDAEPAPTLARASSGPSPTPIALAPRAISAANAAQVKLLGTVAELGDEVVWSPDGRWLFGQGYVVGMFDAATLKQVRTFKGGGSSGGLALSPDGTNLAVLSGGVTLFNPATGGQSHTLFRSDVMRSSACGSFLAYSPDGATLAVQVEDVIQVYDVGSGQQVNTIVAKGGNAIAFTADGQGIYVGRWEGGVVLDITAGEELFRFGENPGDVVCLTRSADGTLLATAGNFSDSIAFREGATGRLLRTTRTLPEKGIMRMAFSPDGQVLATAGRDLIIRLWDVASGEELRSLTGHTDEPDSLAFSPDGALLASAGRDRTARLWGIEP